jgi:hypothetical protein
VGAVVGVERCNLREQASLGDKGDEGKEPSSLEPRVWEPRWAVGVEICNLVMQANLGDEGNEGKEPSSLGPRVGAAVGVERCTLGMQNLETRVAKAKTHHHWGRVCGSGGGCREMQLGDANLGDKGDEGKEPSSLGPRVGAAVGVERCNLGMQILGTRVTKAKSHRRWSRACGSGGRCREMQLGKASKSW